MTCFETTTSIHTTGCFICAMESGVQVYNVEPLAEKGRIGK